MVILHINYIWFYIVAISCCNANLELSKKIINQLSWQHLNLSLEFQDQLEVFFNLKYLKQVQTDLLETLKNGILNCQNHKNFEHFELPENWKKNEFHNKQHCFIPWGRYSGTDIYGSIITEKREFSVKDCQEQCKMNEECYQ